MSAINPTAGASGSARIGPIRLSPGVRPRHAVALFYSATFMMVMINVVVLLNPYLLHQHLGMPTEVQGNFTGNLTVLLEIIVFALVVPLGGLSDRIGRRPIFVAAFLFFAAGLALMPFATTPLQYVLTRCLTAAGAACGVTMVSAVLADYPDNSDRGKMIGLNGIFVGLGLVLIASFGFAQMPEILSRRGFTGIDAGVYTFGLAALVALVSALVARFGLKGRDETADSQTRESFSQQLRVGFAAIRGNPHLRLGAVATFVSRGDLTVLAGFFTLWLVALGTDGGLQAADAQGMAGRLFGISQLAMLLFIPVMGFIADRFDRTTALIVAMAVATLGYGALGIVPNPLESPLIYPVALLAGAGEAGVIVTAPALVGQEAPARVRGSVIGFMALVGALGVLINVKVAGVLFDTWMYQGPFLWMAGLNAVVLCWAVYVRLHSGAGASAA